MKWRPVDPETAPKMVADAIGPGVMDPETIIDELTRIESMDRIDAKLAVMRAIHAEAIEEHPYFAGYYWVPDPDPPDRI